jgi:solute carrier family 35 protein E1
MAAMKEVSFSISGFNGAMISNVAMVLRNITSKKQLNDFKAVDGINLYGILGIVGLFYLAPAAVYMEGSQSAPRSCARCCSYPVCFITCITRYLTKR